MTDEQLAAAKIKVIALPTVLGAVVPVYNIPGVNKDLNFSGDVIADIYLGKITTWNDPRIAKDNPGVNLPNNAILPVYRSDGSGTTFIFTDYLSKVSPDWNSRSGERHRGQVAYRHRSEGQRRRRRNGSPVAQLLRLRRTDLRGAEQDVLRLGEERRRQVREGKSPTASRLPLPLRRKSMPADYRVSITNAPGADVLPDLQLHLAVDPHPLRRSGQGQGPGRTSSAGCSITAKPRPQP